MASKEQKAREVGIEVRQHMADYRTPCPACSPNRRKKKDPCLHVTITSEAVKAFCFHCDFKGTYTDDDQRRDAFGPRSARDRHRTRQPARPVQRQARGW